MNLNSVHWKEMFVSRQTKENIRLRRFSSSILGSVQRTVLDEFYTDKLAGYHTTLFLSGTTLPTTSLPHRVMHRRWTLKFFHVSFIYWNWLLSREAFSLVWAHFLVVFGNERVEINLKRLNPTENPITTQKGLHVFISSWLCRNITFISRRPSELLSTNLYFLYTCHPINQ